MGRPERALDPLAGPVQRFASELMEARRAGGSRPYRDMAEDAGFSIATLSKATAGERLPSLAVVLGYVRACGGDLGEWEARWTEAQAAVAGEARDDEDAEPPYRGLARVIAAWLLLLAVVAGLGVTLHCKVTTEFSVPGIESQKAQDKEKFPEAAGGVARGVFEAPEGGSVSTPTTTAMKRV